MGQEAQEEGFLWDAIPERGRFWGWKWDAVPGMFIWVDLFFLGTDIPSDPSTGSGQAVGGEARGRGNLPESYGSDFVEADSR